MVWNKAILRQITWSVESLPLQLWKGLTFLLEWILQNMVRHFVTHKQVQADKRHPI